MLIVLVELLVEFHSSDAAVGVPPVCCPAAARADVKLPEPPGLNLVVDMSATSAQPLPFHSSVIATRSVVNPPKIKPDVLSAPAGPAPLLAVFTSLTSVQAEPFQDSVVVDGLVAFLHWYRDWGSQRQHAHHSAV